MPGCPRRARRSASAPSSGVHPRVTKRDVGHILVSLRDATVGADGRQVLHRHQRGTRDDADRARLIRDLRRAAERLGPEGVEVRKEQVGDRLDVVRRAQDAHHVGIMPQGVAGLPERALDRVAPPSLDQKIDVHRQPRPHVGRDGVPAHERPARPGPFQRPDDTVQHLELRVHQVTEEANGDGHGLSLPRARVRPPPRKRRGKYSRCQSLLRT